MTSPGRPRSESARAAVLRAVDDLLLDEGYAAMTMKSIAERAGVGRQTLYRWWSTKAEVLLEACLEDARTELAVPLGGPGPDRLSAYVRLVVGFLTASPAGAAYRALLGEAQHDAAVAELLGADDPLLSATAAVLTPLRDELPSCPPDDVAVAQLVGPLLVLVMTGRSTRAVSYAHPHAVAVWRTWSAPAD